MIEFDSERRGHDRAPTGTGKAAAVLPHSILVAAATAAAATAASAGWAGRFCGATGYRGAEDGELDGGFLAGTFGAGDFLLAVDDDFFEL